MEQGLKHDLYNQLIHIERDIDHKWPAMGNRFRATNITKREFVDKAIPVVDILKQHPYLSAKAVSDQTGLSRHHMAVIYKMIQRSDVCQDLLRHTVNRDYFNVVNHYFNHSLYTLVFFVGTTCPSRCIYCPNVHIDSLGRRRLVRYHQDKGHTLSPETLNKVFDDLTEIKRRKKDILVKISGGLEPLTDLATMTEIISRCRDRGLPVKLFTNGILLKHKDRRAVALTAGDVRISLSTADEDTYETLCFSHKKSTAKHKALSLLKQSIRAMIRERPAINPHCKIGFNSVILPDNHRSMISLMELARDLGIDYVDFKPDYFASYDEKAQEAMDESIREAKVVASHESYRDLFVNFTGSLSRQDLYWNPWPGSCDAIKQSNFKMFITPYGQCSPIHYGAFPHSAPSFNQSLSSYTIGDLNPAKGLLDVLSHPDHTPEIEMKKLNPFELMLALEINREESDKTWGLPICVSPYHTRERDQVPADLFFRFDMKE